MHPISVGRSTTIVFAVRLTWNTPLAQPTNFRYIIKKAERTFFFSSHFIRGLPSLCFDNLRWLVVKLCNILLPFIVSSLTLEFPSPNAIQMCYTNTTLSIQRIIFHLILGPRPMLFKQRHHVCARLLFAQTTAASIWRCFYLAVHCFCHANFSAITTAHVYQLHAYGTHERRVEGKNKMKCVVNWRCVEWWVPMRIFR